LDGWMDGWMDGVYGNTWEGLPTSSRPLSSSLAFLVLLPPFSSLLFSFFPLCHFDAHICLISLCQSTSKRTLLCVIIMPVWACFARSGWMELGSCYLIFDSFVR
jgi:hypothetical protein